MATQLELLRQSLARREPVYCLLRPPGSLEILLASTSRIARCGPARRVVWEGPGQR